MVRHKKKKATQRSAASPRKSDSFAYLLEALAASSSLLLNRLPGPDEYFRVQPAPTEGWKPEPKQDLQICTRLPLHIDQSRLMD